MSHCDEVRFVIKKGQVNKDNNLNEVFPKFFNYHLIFSMNIKFFLNITRKYVQKRQKLKKYNYLIYIDYSVIQTETKYHWLLEIKFDLKICIFHFTWMEGKLVVWSFNLVPFYLFFYVRNIILLYFINCTAAQWILRLEI